MNELHTPPAHTHHRTGQRRPTQEHDRSHEETLPIDAPDVEGPQEVDDTRIRATPRHPGTT